MKDFKLRSTGRAAAIEVPAKRKGKSVFSRLNAWLHLWPSLLSGLILVAVCLSGTLIVYCDEILEFNAGKAKYVSIGKEKASAEDIIASVHRLDKNYMLSQIVFFQEADRSVRIRAFHKNTRKLTFIYVDPYSAKVLHVDPYAHFFYVTAHFHSNLLAGKTGGWIVVISTIIFLMGCITGLILWWPKRWNKKSVQDSFTVKWKAKFKRLNYDLHNVYGFYSLLLCFILSLTGIIIFFHSFGEMISKSMGGSDGHYQESLAAAIEGKQSIDVASLAYQTLLEHPEKKNAAVWLSNLDKLGVYVINLGVAGLKSTENFDFVAYDRYSGQQLTIEKPYTIHEKVENTIWQLHMGQWWGQFGKLSTFLAGVIGTSLPITGFLIWWGRRKKKKKTVKPKKAVLKKQPENINVLPSEELLAYPNQEIRNESDGLA